MSWKFGSVKFAGFAVLGIAAAMPAFAWEESAVADWTARNVAIAAAVNQPIPASIVLPDSAERALYATQHRGFSFGRSEAENADEAAAANYINGLAQACDGLTGELIKNGGRNMPVWAQTAQQKFCVSVSDLKQAYKNKPHDRDRCKSLDSAMSYAKKAEAGEDPEAVIASAATLVAAAESLRNLPIVLIQKSKILGDGQRTFTCK